MFKRMIMGSPWSTEPDQVERYCAEAEKLGVTSLIVNILPDPFHPEYLADPSNRYVNFGLWGPSLDQFVDSRLSEGVYPKELLVRNQNALLKIVEIARSHGLKPMFLCGEPRFQPERFFKKYPYLRGPRVDNPGSASVVPLYALCTDLPEVQEHYRELMGKIMKLVPDMDGIIFYSFDSGTGFCHSPSLYAGPNGPQFCKSIPPGERMYRFIKLLLESGQEINPEFRVLLFHYIRGKEREETLKTTPKGVSSIALGYFVAGGFEDCYAMYQYGMKIDEVGYDRAREERKDMMKKDITFLRSLRKTPVATSQSPVEEWLNPMRTLPYPFQTLEIMDILDEMDTEEVLFYGHFSDPALVPYEANRRAIQWYLKHPNDSIEQTVRSVAEEWVTLAHSDPLMEAWRLCDRAYRQRPLWVHSFGFGPIVPRAGEKVKVPRYGSPLDESYRTWMLRRYESHVFPLLKEADKLLSKEIINAKGKARGCLESHRLQIGVFYHWQRSQYNRLESGRFLEPGMGDPEIERSIPEIIDDEIQNIQELMELARGHAVELFTIYSREDIFGEDMENNIATMKAHRDDTPYPRKLMFPHKPRT